MHRRIVLLGVLAVFVLALMLPVTGAGFEIEDHETVYGLLDSAGNPKDLTVVDWLRVRGQGSVKLIDPAGDLTEIKNVKGSERPQLANNCVVWNTRTNDGFKDIFYSGRTTKSLPIEIKLTYIVNGKEVPGSKVSDSRGDLTVNISILNKLKTNERYTYAGQGGEPLTAQEDVLVPMVVNATIDIPSTKFQRIEAPEATTAVTGATVKVSWIVFPYPSSNLTLRLSSNDRFKLEPFYFVIAPKMPPISGLEVRSQLLEMASGMQRINQALEDLYDGAVDLAKGGDQLADGAGALQSGLNDLGRLNDAHQLLVGRLSEGISGIDVESLASSLDRLGELDNGLKRMDSALGDMILLNEAHQQIVNTVRKELDGYDLSEFSASLKTLDSELKTLSEADRYLSRAAASYEFQAKKMRAARERQDEISARLDRLAKNIPAVINDVDYKELKKLMALEKEDLDDAVQGGRENGESFDGIIYTSRVLDTMAKSMTKAKESLAGMKEGTGKANLLMEGFNRLKQALKVLSEGGIIERREIPGLNTAGTALGEVKTGVKQIRDGLAISKMEPGLLDKLKSGLLLLRTAIGVLLHGGTIEGQNVPGLDTAGKGLQQAGEGLAQVGVGAGKMKDGAWQIRDGLGQMQSEGIQKLSNGVDDAIESLNKAEALKKLTTAKVAAYDHFIGKPQGATGEVRFLLRTQGL